MEEKSRASSFRNTIKSQLIIGVALVHAVLMTIFIWDLISRQKDLLLERQVDEATALSKSVATSTAGWVASKDYIGIQEIINAQSRYPELSFAMVMDEDGRILSHIDTTKIGMYLKHELPEKKETTILFRSPELVDAISPIYINNKHIGWVRIGLGKINIAEKISNLTTNGVIYALFAILIGSILAWFLGSNLTSKLKTIEQVAQDIAKGKTDKRVFLQGSDEISIVGNTFNLMLDKIEKSKEDLLLANERFSMAVKASQIGVWDYDLINNNLIWDESMYEIYDIKENKFSGAYDAWRNTIHPDDLEEAEIALNDSINGQKDFRETFRILDSNQKVRWILANGKVLYDEHGKAYRMIGTNKNITHQVELENELKENNQRLQIANEKANAAAIARSQFLATMSHELRTPMNGVLGMVELLRETKLDEEQRNYIDVINSSGKTLLTVINDILDFSKLDAHQLKLSLSPMRLEKAIYGVTELLSVNAKLKGLELTTEINDTCPEFIISDLNRIKQILFNLIGNAIKFTDSGYVNVLVDYEEKYGTSGNLVISVRDSGIGINDELKYNLFTPFTQGNNSTSRFFGGTGLGLSIVKKIIEVFKGEITFTSEAGKGSTFKVIIPTEKTTKNDNDVLTKSGPNKIETKEKLRILIAEDITDNQKVLTAMLSNPQFDLHIVEDGKKAVDAFRENNFDLVLMDCFMPVLNGFDAIKEIRLINSNNQAPVPIIAISANTQLELMDNALNAGANDFIFKPLSKKILINKIKKLIG